MMPNGQLVAGGQIKTFVLSQVIKINKDLHTSMALSPARLPQAFVSGWAFIKFLHQANLSNEY
jgi:predicted aspartyl protease